MAAPTPEHLEPLTWLEHLYGTAETGWLNIFTVNRTTGGREVDWAPVTNLEALAAAAALREPLSCVWFGVATRHTRIGGGKRGGTKDCAALPGLWIDIDCAGPGHKVAHRLARDRNHAHQLLNAYPIPPTAIIDTGGGLQAWWLFAELVDLDTNLQRILAAWGATWTRLANEHNIDLDNVFDPARIMRLPGTTNRKEGLARPVALVNADWTSRYGIDDLDTYLDAAPTPPKHRRGGDLPYVGLERPGDAYSLRHTGGDILARHGFTLARTDRNGDEHWTRPGKDTREGTSATVYAADKHTTIYSDTVTHQWPAIEVRRPYDPFGLYVALEHAGDFTAATSTLRAQGYGAPSSGGPDLDDLIGDTIKTGTAPNAAATPAAPTPDDPWPEPIPLGSIHELPPFPIQILPDWIGDWALEVADDIQVPVDLPAMLALGAFSTIAAGHVKINVVNRWTEHANLYLVIAMPPSTGKSPAYKAMCSPVHDIQREHQRMMRDTIGANADMVDALEAELKRTKQLADVRQESLAEIRGRLHEAMDKPTTLPRLTVGDVTPEKLSSLIADNNGAMAVHSTEGGVFSIMAGMYNAKDTSNLDVYLQGWSGDRIDTERVSRGGDLAEEGLLTMLLTVQPSIIGALADNPELAGRGLTARFMYSMPPDILGHRDMRLRHRQEDSGAHDRYGDRLREFGRQFLSWQHPAMLHMDPEGAQHYTDWRQGLEERRRPDGDLRPMAEWTGKLESSVLRVAALLHLAHGNPHGEPVSLTTVAQALALGEYWLAHAGLVHDVWGSSPAISTAREILAWAEARELTEFTVRDLYAGNRARFKKADETLEPLMLLAERGWVRTADGGPIATQRNKRSVALALHPEFSTVSARSARPVLKEQIEDLSLSPEAERDGRTTAQNAQNAQNEQNEPAPQRDQPATHSDPDDEGEGDDLLAGSLWDLDADDPEPKDPQ